MNLDGLLDDCPFLEAISALFAGPRQRAFGEATLNRRRDINR